MIKRLKKHMSILICTREKVSIFYRQVFYTLDFADYDF